MSDKKDTRIDLETLDEIAKKTREMCYHERLLRVSVFATEGVVRELIAELKRCYAMLDAIAYEVAPCGECGGHREEEGLFHDCQNYCRCEE